MQDTAAKGLTDTLLSLTGDAGGPEQLTLAEIVRSLDDQARGILMILFALPNCLPGIPGTSAVTGLPLVFLTLQMALNRPPWLPKFIARRSVSRQWLTDFISDPAHERFYGEKNDNMPAFFKDAANPKNNKLSRRELEMLVDWLRGGK